MADTPHPLFRLPAELYDEVFDRMVENDDVIYCHTKQRALSTANILLANKQLSNHYRAALERRKKNFAVHRAAVKIEVLHGKWGSMVRTLVEGRNTAPPKNECIDLTLSDCITALHLNVRVHVQGAFSNNIGIAALLDSVDIAAPLKPIIHGVNLERILLELEVTGGGILYKDLVTKHLAARAYLQVRARLNKLDWMGEQKRDNKLIHGGFIAHDATGFMVQPEALNPSEYHRTGLFTADEPPYKPARALLDFFRAKGRIIKAFKKGIGYQPGEKQYALHYATFADALSQGHVRREERHDTCQEDDWQHMGKMINHDIQGDRAKT